MTSTTHTLWLTSEEETAALTADAQAEALAGFASPVGFEGEPTGYVLGALPLRTNPEASQYARVGWVAIDPSDGACLITGVSTPTTAEAYGDGISVPDGTLVAEEVLAALEELVLAETSRKAWMSGDPIV